ncbi:MAG: pentapeptide repeat-containing protein [Armatimonadetes bacterium]|nr:pentapeptide repeat-containing protein [Armatimonadota bacterium]
MKLITKVKQFKNIVLRILRNTVFQKVCKYIFLFLVYYITIFTLVLNIYELKLSNINNRVNTVLSILSTPNYDKGLEIIPSIQNKNIPIEPSFFKPITVVKSILFKQNEYRPILKEFYGGYQYRHNAEYIPSQKSNNFISDMLKQIIISWKSELDSINLCDINLSNIDLMVAKFDSTLLINSDFSNSNLSGTRFAYSDLSLSNFSDSRLAYCNFNNAQITNSDFSGCYLFDSSFLHTTVRVVNFDNSKIHSIDFSNTIFWGGISNCSFNNADIRWCNFSGIDSLNIKIFKNTKTLYDCKFENEIKAQILLEYPRLFQKPTD